MKRSGIYKLPDGRELIAGAGYGGVFTLYTPRSWESLGPPEYRVRPDGALVADGEPTGLTLEDLSDTASCAVRRRIGGQL